MNVVPGNSSDAIEQKAHFGRARMMKPEPGLSGNIVIIYRHGINKLTVQQVGVVGMTLSTSLVLSRPLSPQPPFS